eukprot:Polyplicarium_translucidae@DN2230_c0_g1_i1.p1
MKSSIEEALALGCPKIPLEINGHRQIALFDSGASLTIIHPEILASADRTVIKGSRTSMMLASGAKVDLLGKAKIGAILGQEVIRLLDIIYRPKERARATPCTSSEIGRNARRLPIFQPIDR